MKKKAFWTIIIIVITVAIHGVFKPLPVGVSLEMDSHKISSSDIHFFSDVTYTDVDGSRHSEQQIFDEIFRMIDTANSYILLDMFLYNDFLGTATTSYPRLINPTLPL